jgi:hypothetical protein
MTKNLRPRFESSTTLEGYRYTDRLGRVVSSLVHIFACSLTPYSEPSVQVPHGYVKLAKGVHHIYVFGQTQIKRAYKDDIFLMYNTFCARNK